jgi:hypothetical protein
VLSAKGRQRSSSFLKKNQKTFDCAARIRGKSGASVGRGAGSKSFLVLFFKKELLPSRLLSFGG